MSLVHSCPQHLGRNLALKCSINVAVMLSAGHKEMMNESYLVESYVEV